MFAKVVVLALSVSVVAGALDCSAVPAPFTDWCTARCSHDPSDCPATFCSACVDCEDFEVEMYDGWGDGWFDDVQLTFSDCDGTVFADGFMVEEDQYNTNATLECAPSGFSVSVGSNEGSDAYWWSIRNSDGEVVLTGGDSYTGSYNCDGSVTGSTTIFPPQYSAVNCMHPYQGWTNEHCTANCNHVPPVCPSCCQLNA